MEFLGDGLNHQNISFVLFRAWHGTVDPGLFTKWRKLRYSKTRIAYYSNSMATQALLLSGDVEKNPGPSQGKAASTNNKLSRSKPTAAKCDHCQKTIRWNQKNISCANCMGCFHLKCVYLKSVVNNWLCNRCTWAALPFYKCSDAEMLNEANVRFLITCVNILLLWLIGLETPVRLMTKFSPPTLVSRILRRR